MPDNLLFSADPAHDIKRFAAKKKYSKMAVLTDENTLKHCYPLLEKGLPAHDVITVESGEEHKTLQTCERIWRSMTGLRLDRHSVLVILGGGVLGDMGGFCAATYKRGIDFILTPTTLLAQADASIGGKLGIDFDHYKNHLGVFQFPVLTVMHSGFLKTLPRPELLSGFAEIVKHALIADRQTWESIRVRSLEDQPWDQLVQYSATFKSGIVEKDPREGGLRKILNAGHTIGHAVESFLLQENRKVMHGEAVAAGLIAEAYIATERQMLSLPERDDIARFILNVYGKIRLEEQEEEAIAGLTIQDKKNKGNRILCVLLDGIGRARWDEEISTTEVKRALSFYRSL